MPKYAGVQAQTEPTDDQHPENAPETEREWKAAAERAGWDFEDGRPPVDHGIYQDGLAQSDSPPGVAS